MKMKYDITAIGNALVDTQFKVSHEFIAEVGLEIDQMNLSSAEEHAPIIDKLKKENAESVSDCGGSATNTLVAATHFGAKCFHTCVVADDEDGRAGRWRGQQKLECGLHRNPNIIAASVA